MSATQTDLSAFEADRDVLTDAEREVYEAVHDDGYGVREYARATDRVPGTVGNLLRRARRKLTDDARIDGP